ncbi:MAG TPA: O-antigen ligase family protein [Baekduia sp.]|uniref:O-antigen ligase family protein n=1 Tax=Baekduia sp. TaxID=2600305 RepID=UPI002D77F88E|nr:O-antigen ligase family protein [Baekduia sp.]HET6507263.1 O-antigen ligase family protein [Baekduia sp.]
MLARLRAAPVTVPTLLAVAVFLAWTPFDGAQAVTRWAPGGIALIALLAATGGGLGLRWRAVPGAVRAAVVLLAAFTAWSYLSLAWAHDGGAALEGANRTLLYLVVFALFALWPQRPATAAWVLGLWTAGIGVLALITLIRLGTLADPHAALFGRNDRLLWPIGYPNAEAATWLMAFWPAVAFAASARVPWVLRGGAAALGVVLADVALLSQSRGSILALPACVAVFLIFVPGRLRHVAALLPIAGLAALAVPKVLDVGDAIDADGAVADAGASAMKVVLLMAVVAGVIVAAAGAWESLRPPAERTAQRIRTTWRALVVAGVALGAVGGLVAVGNPVHRVDHAWDSFKGGYEDNTGSSSRLTAGLGSNRYDFYRVSLDLFADHPIAGVGADNFFQDYLRLGDSPETPSYPHNLVLRTLSQTGIVGTLLLLGAFGAALAAAGRAMRRSDPLAATVAGGAVIAFAYWVAHGMTDWFWEWAGLGAPAFALLGLACALAPRPAVAPEAVPDADADADAAAAAGGGAWVRRPGPVALVLGGAAAVVAALVLAGPWLAERDVERAGQIWAQRPFEAYSRLDRAADLDPLSDRPASVKGSIALRYGDLDRAKAAFSDALDRNPRDQYATLELGAIASVRRDPATAERLLARAVALAPRDRSAREALDVVRSGGTVDISVLNDRIRSSADQLAGT